MMNIKMGPHIQYWVDKRIIIQITSMNIAFSCSYEVGRKIWSFGRLFWDSGENSEEREPDRHAGAYSGEGFGGQPFFLEFFHFARVFKKKKSQTSSPLNFPIHTKRQLFGSKYISQADSLTVVCSRFQCYVDREIF